MKKLLSVLILWGGVLALSSCSKDDSAEKIGSVIPDANFRAALVELGFVETSGGIDPNNATNKALFASTTKLVLFDRKIASLKGIEYFTELTELDCSLNHLTTLDAFNNKKLIALYCFENQLTTLDLSQNPALTYVNCRVNRLTTLDLSKNLKLSTLNCSENQLTALDVSQNTELDLLVCRYNRLTELDLSNNTKLSQLFCNDNQLPALDLSQNKKLSYLNCYSNQLSALDISMITAPVMSLYCGNQQPDKTLSLTLTAAQNASWKSQGEQDNARITKVIK